MHYQYTTYITLDKTKVFDIADFNMFSTCSNLETFDLDKTKCPTF